MKYSSRKSARDRVLLTFSGAYFGLTLNPSSKISTARLNCIFGLVERSWSTSRDAMIKAVIMIGVRSGLLAFRSCCHTLPYRAEQKAVGGKEARLKSQRPLHGVIIQNESLLSSRKAFSQRRRNGCSCL